MRQTVLVVAVVALVALAGCSGGGGSSTETTAAETTGTSAETTPTRTSAPGTTTTPTTEPTEDLEPVSAMSSLPPGVTEQGVTNVTALFAAEKSTFSNSGFEYDMVFRNSTRSSVRLRVVNDTTASYAEFDGGNASRSGAFYLEGDSAGTYEGQGNVTYGNGPTSVRWSTGFTVAIYTLVPRGYVSSLEWETEGVYTTDSGEQRLVLTSNALNESATGGLFAPTLVDDDETARSVSGRVEVTTDGVVRYGNLSATVEKEDGATYTKGLEFTTGLDPGTIQQPDWFESVSKPTLSVESDDRLLAYEYTGDQSLEAGTTLAIGTGTSGFDVETAANVTLEQSVTPGETVYVYRTGDGEDATYTAAVGERPSVPDDAVAFSEVVTVTVRIGDIELEAGASTRDD